MNFFCKRPGGWSFHFELLIFCLFLGASSKRNRKLEPDHECCLDWRRKYNDTLNTIKQLEKKILKANKLSKKEQTFIVKQNLKEVGHKETEFKHILNPGIHNKNYTQEDVCNALILRSMSNKSFEFLRRNKILPLPSRTTLSKWVDKLDCKPGFNNNFLFIRNLKQIVLLNMSTIFF